MLERLHLLVSLMLAPALALSQADAVCALAAHSLTNTEAALAAPHDRAALEGGAMPCLPAPISLALQPTRVPSHHSLTRFRISSGWVCLRDTSNL